MKAKEFEPAYWAKSLRTLATNIGYPGSSLPDPPGSDGAQAAGADAFVGLLEFDGSGPISLEFPVGMLLKPVTQELEGGLTISLGEHETTEAVYGYSQKGNWFVLRDASQSSSRTSMPGLSTQTLAGSSLLVARSPIPSRPMVDHLSIGLDGLDEWIRRSPVKETMHFKEEANGSTGPIEKFSIDYLPDSIGPITLYEAAGCKVYVQIAGVWKGGPVVAKTEYGMTTSCSLEVELVKPMDLDEALLTWVYPLRNLLALLMGAYCSIESIHAHSTDSDCDLEYYAPYVDRDKPISQRETMQMPFPYPAVEGRTQEIVETCFGLDSDARNAADITISLLNSWMMPYDLEFVACASALEALSRVGEKQERYDQERFDREKAAMLESVSDKDFRNWVEGVLWNRRSARSLARSLLKKLEPVTSYVVPNADLFQDHLRACRNAYVHRDGMEGDAVLKGYELYVHTRAVWFLSYAALLSLVGIPTEEISHAIQEKAYKSGEISAIRAQYSSTGSDTEGI